MTETFRHQRTIAKRAEITGFGYWTGRDTHVQFEPAEPGSGIVFVRRDLSGQTRIPALVQNRIEIPRRTALGCCCATVEMVEHIMAALAGLQIDNCEVWVDGAEMPGMDGSSWPFVEVLDEAGVEQQDAIRPTLVIDDVTRVGDTNSWVEAKPAAENVFSIRCRIDYSSVPSIGRQTYEAIVTPEVFREELSKCRTFLLREEAEWLVAQGLGSRATCKDVLVFEDDGPIDNTLRFENECVRHKALDLIGDLALAGCDLVGQITSQRSGHRLNAEIVKAIAKEGQVIQ